MGKIGKIIAGIFAGIVGLIVILFIAALVLTKLYSDDIRAFAEQKVEEQTGRTLSISGDIGISLFPWVGVQLGAIELGNAPGFGPEPFASIQRADVRLKLMPLLHKQVEADTIVLDGLQLSLGRNAEGVSNWDDLAGTPAPTEVKQPAESKPEAKTQPKAGQDLGEVLAALNIGGVAISNASVVWDDRQAGQRVAISEFDLTLGALQLNQPFPLELSMQVDSDTPDMHGRIQLAAEVVLDLNGQIYRLNGMNLVTDLKSQLVPGGKLAAKLSSDVEANLAAQTATLSKLQLDTMGARVQAEVNAEKLLEMPDFKGKAKVGVVDGAQLNTALGGGLPLKGDDLKSVSLDADFTVSLGQQTLSIPKVSLAALGIVLNGQANGTRIIDAPSFTGHLQSNEFVPRDVAEKLAVALPEMADPSTLTKASLGFEFNAGLEQAGVDKLLVKFDDSQLQGQATVKNFAKPEIRYDLEVDAIDADRYLPPPAPEGQTQPETPAGEGGGGKGKTKLPLEQLRSLDIQGSFRLGKLKVMNLHSQQILATLTAKDGLIRVYPVGAKLYEGSYAGDLSFDVRNDVPQLGMDEKLSGVQAGPLLKDFMGKPYVSGKANLSAKLSAAGIKPMAIRKSLNGTAAFLFENGAVDGINIAQLIRNAYAAYTKEPAAEDEVKQTDFAELKGTVQVKNGLVSNKDLSAKSPLFRIAGSGTADLVSEKLDYLVKPTIVGSLEGQGGKEITDLKGLTVPVRITGTFQKPEFGVELDKLLEEKAKAALEGKKQEVQQNLDKQKRKAKAKAQRQIEEKKQDLEQQLRDKLKF